MTLDRELVTRKLLLNTADIDPPREIHKKGIDAFLASRIDQAVVERILELAITRMIDVNYHVITALGHPPPADYHSSFSRLGELTILLGEFARRIAAAAVCATGSFTIMKTSIRAKYSRRSAPHCTIFSSTFRAQVTS